MSDIKLLLVDDQPVVREGLRRMIELDKDIKVIGEAQSGEEAITKVQNMSPDVVLMDVQMGGMNGIEATRQIKAKHNDSNVIILTVYDDKYLSQAAEAGAVGYLLKDINQKELVKAIKLAHCGKSPVADNVSRKLFKHYGEMVESNKKSLLNPRQLTILRLIASGATNKAIAQKLYLSEATIKRETTVIFDKLGVTDRTHAVAEAYARNLL